MRGVETDEQFDEKVKEFSKKLELLGNAVRKNNLVKKRPNYNDAWVRSLKTQLQTLNEKQRTRSNYSQHSTANSSSGSGAGKAAR